MSNEDNEYHLSQLPDRRYVVVVAVGRLSSLLSICGSLNICYLVIRRKRWKELYHRLVLGVSVSDALASFGLLVQPFAMPRWTGFLFAIGNDATCTTAAVLVIFNLSSMLYSFCLSVFFVLMIRSRKTDGQISNLVEPWVHIVAPGVPLVMAVVAASRSHVGPNAGLRFCFASVKNSDCYYDAIEGVDCDVASSTSITLALVQIGLDCCLALGGIICMVLIWRSTMKQAQANRSYSIDGSLSAQHEKRIRAVAMQALCYGLAFVSVILWSFTSGYVSRRYRAGTLGENQQPNLYFALLILGWFFVPLQGFFNWMIYIRPRLLRWKDANPDKTWLWAYLQVLTSENPPVTVRTEHLEDTPGAGLGRSNQSSKDNHLVRGASSSSFLSSRAFTIAGVAEWLTRQPRTAHPPSTRTVRSSGPDISEEQQMEDTRSEGAKPLDGLNSPVADGSDFAKGNATPFEEFKVSDEDSGDNLEQDSDQQR